MTNNLKFSPPPPEEPSSKYFPRMGRNVTVANCYYYVGFLELFWTFFDTLTPIEQQIYLARAEWRYEEYLLNYNKLCTKPPPLDIAFLWHVHMLSPFHYYEDLILRFQIPEVFKRSLPLYDIRMVGDNPYPIPPEKWNEVFDDEPFILTKQNMNNGTYKRKCYNCQSIIELPWSVYTTYRFGKNTALFPHDGCGPAEGINFLDITRMKLEADLFKPIPAVAGTLLTSDGTIKDYPNRMIPFVKRISVIIPKNELDFAYEKQLNELLKFHGEKYEYDANELLYAIRTCYQGNPSPFSIDLLHGVARQRRFYDDIMDVNWERSQGFVLGIRHYHDFLALLHMNPYLRAVPTLEIDVAFHTHMMHSYEYRKFMLNHLGRVINHDDDVPETKPFFRLESKLKLSLEQFKSYYFPGKISITYAINFSDLSRSANVLNKICSDALIYIYSSIARYKNKSLAVSVSVHNYGVDRRFYERGNEVHMKELQNFVTEGMQHHCYGYIGCVTIVNGGRSALIYKKNHNINDTEEVKLIFNPMEQGKWYKKRKECVRVRSAFSNFTGFKSIKSFDHQDPALPVYAFDDLPTYNEANSFLGNVTRKYIKYSSFTYAKYRDFNSSSVAY
ncbi:hypothetical protein BJ944DRAFT_289790 [Cunninghamella echinulata]|nr:hypothetical protein BJ944DRAFT_289790 [Cunninghamella echinulata]